VIGGILVGVSIFVIGYDIDDENEEIMLLFLSLFYHYRLCSAIAMSGSSLVVALNALSLKRVKVKEVI
jgi:cation transport ATPase